MTFSVNYYIYRVLFVFDVGFEPTLFYIPNVVPYLIRRIEDKEDSHTLNYSTSFSVRFIPQILTWSNRAVFSNALDSSKPRYEH